jgi:Na+/H+-dicarboxylate symporter
LIAGEIVDAEPMDSILEKLGLYVLTVIVGLLVHGFVVLPFIYGFMTGKFPFRYIMNMGQALLMAFGTAAR